MNLGLDAPPPTGPSQKDMKDFQTVARIAREEAGLAIPSEKASMVFARLSKRLRANGISDRSEYCRFVERPENSDERRKLISTLTTNVTSFFREAHHFEFIRERVLPDLSNRARSGNRIRMWSAGCSSGQEPFSLAMLILDALPEACSLDVRILATDIDSEILSKARAAIVDTATTDSVPPPLRRKFLHHGPKDDQVVLSPEVRRLITFRELNLLATWPVRGPFDLVFCRNVVIYFDQATQNTLWPRFETVISPGGHLFLGHSERIEPSAAGKFRAVATTTYQRETSAGSQVQRKKE